MLFAIGCGDGGGGTAGTGGAGAAGGSGGSGASAGSGGSGGALPPGTKDISLGCSNSSPIGAQSILSARLKVVTDTVAASSSFDADLSGTSTFPEAFLDAAQALVPGGLSQAQLLDAAYIVQVRSGATRIDGGGGSGGSGGTGGSDGSLGVTLTPDVAAITPGEVRLCNYPPTQVCTANEDCTGMVCREPIVLVDIPVSDDCAADGFCADEGKTDQCDANGFCVEGDLEVPLSEQTQAYMAEASGNVLFGWGDQGLPNNTFDPMTDLYTIPKADPRNEAVQGLRVAVGALTVLIECVMGIDEGTDPDDAENTLVGLTPDEDLIPIPIEE